MSARLFPASQSESAGASSLLHSCVKLQQGQHLILVEEIGGSDFYDEAAPAVTEAMAKALGARVDRVLAPPLDSTEAEMNGFLSSLRHCDHIVFFARIGDQIRFSNLGEFPPATMCYTLDVKMLDSPFGTACHHGMCAIKSSIDEAFSQAAEIHVTCPRGTNYFGSTPTSTGETVDVSINRFPMLVPAPINADGFSGEVVLSRFLVGTGSRQYEPYYLPLESDVVASVRNNLITDFSGDSEQVRKVQAHYEKVSSEFSIDPWYLHSWHAGIHPGCGFTDDAAANIVRWSGCAFGNTRLLHFHTCGEYAPGEISWNIIDPTIRLDGIAIWENGRLYPDRIPACRLLFEQHPRLELQFNNPQTAIGLN